MKNNHSTTSFSNNKIPTISILCKIKNGGRYLPYLLYMYQYQDYPGEQSELIIIDDSADSNVNIINLFSADIKKPIKYYHISDYPALTKKFPTSNIKGDYVIFLEEYDYISLLFTKKISQLMVSTKCKMVTEKQSFIWYTPLKTILLQENENNSTLVACHRSQLPKTGLRTKQLAQICTIAGHDATALSLSLDRTLLRVIVPQKNCLNDFQVEKSYLSTFMLQEIITDNNLLDFYNKLTEHDDQKIKWDTIDNIVILDDGTSDVDRIKSALGSMNVPDEKINYYSLPIADNEAVSKSLAHIGVANMASTKKWANYLIIENGVHFTVYKDSYKKINALFAALQNLDLQVIVLGAAILNSVKMTNIDSLLKVNKLKANCCYVVNQNAYKKIIQLYQSQLITLKLAAFALSIPADGEVVQSISNEENWLTLLPNFAYQYQRYNGYSAQYQNSLPQFFSNNQLSEIETNTPLSTPANNLKDCVGFYMATSFQYNIYEQIINKLQQRGIQCCLVFIDTMEAGFIDDMLQFFQKIKVKNLAIETWSSIKQFGEKLSIMVSPYYCSSLTGIARYYVRAMYGVGKEGWDHAWWNIMFDKILCYGPYHKERLSITNNCTIVGNPRFDLWYQPDKRINIDSLIKLDKKKPILLYAPTYGVLSSIDSWSYDIGKLQRKYNVIIKLHHRIAFANDCAMQFKIAKSNFTNIITRADINFELLECCDYVLTDSSGFIFDAIQAKKKIIILTNSQLDYSIKKGQGYSNIDSAEFTIRDYLPVANNLKNLLYFLSNKYDWLKNEKTLNRIRDEYCDPWQDGNSAERAADCIAELLHAEIPVISNDVRINLRNFIFKNHET